MKWADAISCWWEHWASSAVTQLHQHEWKVQSKNLRAAPFPPCCSSGKPRGAPASYYLINSLHVLLWRWLLGVWALAPGWRESYVCILTQLCPPA